VKTNRNFCLKLAVQLEKTEQQKELGVVTQHRMAVGLL